MHRQLLVPVLALVSVLDPVVPTPIFFIYNVVKEEMHNFVECKASTGTKGLLWR